MKNEQFKKLPESPVVENIYNVLLTIDACIVYKSWIKSNFKNVWNDII